MNVKTKNRNIGLVVTYVIAVVSAQQGGDLSVLGTYGVAVSLSFLWLCVYFGFEELHMRKKAELEKE